MTICQRRPPPGGTGRHIPLRNRGAAGEACGIKRTNALPTKVKICGITRVEDALAAVAAGADALGFMFYAQSPRHVSFSEATLIARHVPPAVSRVGVFVNPTAGELLQAIAECGLDTLQFHGEESPDFIASLPLNELLPHRPIPGASPGRFEADGRPIRTIKAFRVHDAASLAGLTAHPTDLWLLDAYVPGARGGTGARFDWDLAVEAGRLGRGIVLAGGLTPENVAEAIRTVRPFAVDVSSGVEAAPGRKDPERIRAFIEAAKSVR